LLGTIGEAKAVPGLAALLADDSDAVRRAAAMALGEIGDPAGFEPLVEACQDADVDVRRAAAVGLNRMDDALLAPLLDALASGDLATVARAHMFYIVRGQAGSEDVLVEALAQHGTKEMALDYMNSGHGPLAEAGKAWAKEHGYIVVPLPGGSGAGKWGSGP
jgi:HEAT repeat protein